MLPSASIKDADACLNLEALFSSGSHRSGIFSSALRKENGRSGEKGRMVRHEQIIPISKRGGSVGFVSWLRAGFPRTIALVSIWILIIPRAGGWTHERTEDFVPPRVSNNCQRVKSVFYIRLERLSVAAYSAWTAIGRIFPKELLPSFSTGVESRYDRACTF